MKTIATRIIINLQKVGVNLPNNNNKKKITININPGIVQ